MRVPARKLLVLGCLYGIGVLRCDLPNQDQAGRQASPFYRNTTKKVFKERLKSVTELRVSVRKKEAQTVLGDVIVERVSCSVQSVCR